jgi:hypothetical protein
VAEFRVLGGVDLFDRHGGGGGVRKSLKNRQGLGVGVIGIIII